MSSEIVERLRGYDRDYVKYDLLLDAASHIEALEAENERLSDKVDGLSSDLDNAVSIAYHRGAVDWVRMNYPKHFVFLSQAKE